MRRNINILLQVDWTIILVWLLLVAIGWISIYAAVYDEQHSSILDFSQRYGKQLRWIVAAVILALLTMLIESRFYLFFAWFGYAAALLALVLVLIIGKEVNSSKSWFEIAGISLQPAEFAKVATAMALARYLHSPGHNLTSARNLLEAVAIISTPVILIMLQPDLGSAVVFAALFFVMYREGLSSYLFVTGILMIVLFFITILFEEIYTTLVIIAVGLLFIWIASRRGRVAAFLLLSMALITLTGYVAGRLAVADQLFEIGLVASVLLTTVPMLWFNFRYKLRTSLIVYLFMVGSIIFIYTVEYSFNNLLKPHQQERINVVLGVESDPLGAGYNLHQSIISIGSGGLTGKGFLQGTQTKFRFVPEQSTDFIFCTVGEEWGFIGSSVVIVLFLVLLFRIQILAERQRSVFARVYGYALFSVLFLHLFINIGMTVGLVPVIGIPLPFISYGGSSLWAFTIMLFIFLRLDAGRTEYLV